MERLTKRIDENHLCIEVCEKACIEGNTFCPKCKPFTAVLKKLMEYEDLEEQGKLIKIPFEIGRLLYDITEFKEKHECPEIYVIDTTSFSLSKDKKGLIYILDSCEYRYEDFGVVLFASKKEAENALAKMEKKDEVQ